MENVKEGAPPVTMEHKHKTHRLFMNGNGPEYEPNEYYRPWLEANIGKQGIDWDWELASGDLDRIAIYFTESEHGILFELKWPHI